MKKIAVAICAVLTTTGAMAQVLDEDITETIVLEGALNEVLYDFVSVDPQAAVGERFRATIEINRYASIGYDLDFYRDYSDAVASIVFEVFDAQGLPVELPIETRCNDEIYADAFGNRQAYARLSEGQINSASYMIENITKDASFLACGIRLDAAEQTLFDPVIEFPIPLTGQINADMSFRVESGSQPIGNPTGIFAGQVDQVTVSGFDSDGDGIADELDACQFSTTEETVLLAGWYETGVTNYLDESGCSISDRFAACEVTAESQPVAPAGPVFSAYSGPSYCETQIAYGLQREGIIDFSESLMLRNALYNYHRSGGNGPR